MKPIEMSTDKYIELCLGLISKGWWPVGDYHKKEMKFARGNKVYDLSAADLTKLEEIEQKGLFLLTNP